ncbi:putative Beta-1,3-galactosyltransferase 1 [Hypsibius exemplaris]|uniref:Hexosyltransferase n=1 Tax=Hypsibius exemplaris TaxID=2072580 RepID=A0A1W0WTU2_HYPEX|nr:putative Beta-1,3-galactosyltransferase 1 [Hypsibius exemplaris]
MFNNSNKRTVLQLLLIVSLFLFSALLAVDIVLYRVNLATVVQGGQSTTPLVVGATPWVVGANASVTATTTAATFVRDAPKQYRVSPYQVDSHYTIRPAACNLSVNFIDIVFLIHSAPGNLEKRQAVRRTWGSLITPNCGLKRIFVFGKISDQKLQMALQVESDAYGDLLQTTNDDGYRVSSLNTLYAFQWIAAHCSETYYTARADDDVFVNVPKLHSFLTTKFGSGQAFGLPIGVGSKVFRDPGSKYYVPREEFPPDKFPNYFSGTLVSFPTNQVARLLFLSRQSATMFLDDAYVYGVLLGVANITISPQPAIGIGLEGIDKGKCIKRDMTAVHYVTVANMDKLWDDKCHRYEKIC